MEEHTMDNINIKLEDYFHDEVNTYGVGVAKVTTKYGELTDPWHIQALIAEQCDIVITLDAPHNAPTITAKVKSIINMDYPDLHWFTLVMDVKINDEIMEVWFTDKFYEEGHKYIMFYPKSRLPRLNADIICHQCEINNGCAYDKNEGPDKCHLLNTNKPGFVNVDYDKVNPWEFLDNMAVNVYLLGASYSHDPNHIQPEYAGCVKAVKLILELRQLISAINI
jgi:hypothetical protein